MKTCKKCGQDKPLSEFYINKKMAGGHLSACKECVKAVERKRRSDALEAHREYDRKRANLPHRLEARLAYQATDQGRAAGSRAKKAYAYRHDDRRAAHVMAGNAIRDGRLIPLPCEVCGAGKTEGHHAAYSLPLLVTWLCTKHHAQLHKEHRAYLRANPPTQKEAA